MNYGLKRDPNTWQISLNLCKCRIQGVGGGRAIRLYLEGKLERSGGGGIQVFRWLCINIGQILGCRIQA